MSINRARSAPTALRAVFPSGRTMDLRGTLHVGRLPGYPYVAVAVVTGEGTAPVVMVDPRCLVMRQGRRDRQSRRAGQLRRQRLQQERVAGRLNAQQP